MDWEDCKGPTAEQASNEWCGTIGHDALGLHPLFSTPQMVGPCFVWILTTNLFTKGDPYQEHKTLGDKAMWLLGTRRPLHHNKVTAIL